MTPSKRVLAPAAVGVAFSVLSITAFALTQTPAPSSSNGPAGISVVSAPSVSTASVAIPALEAQPGFIRKGETSTLRWATNGLTGCTLSGGTDFSGAVTGSGSSTVQPTKSTTYAIKCASSRKIIQTVAVVGGNPNAFTNPDLGGIPMRARHPLAFPTALGFGASASVRSPDAVVYKINTLDDVANPSDGKISYRECALALAVTSPYVIPAGRPRYCVFDVAGAISLQSPAYIQVPKIYIAGQTSPGGIEFRLGDRYNPVDSLIDSRRGGNDMIVRHVRTRTGPHVGRTSENGDPIRMSGTYRQILDHVSTMFGTDESLDMACQDCTVQWSIIGPNICRNAGHTSALHCKTFFLKPASRVTIAHNLTQHGEQRGINIAVGIHPAPPGNTGQADIYNNVLYNFIAETGLISNQFGNVYANYVNNVALRGPKYNASDGNYLMGLYAIGTSKFGFDIHAKGNVTPRTRVSGQFGSTVDDPQTAAAGPITGVDPNAICALKGGAIDCSIRSNAVIRQWAYALAPGITQPSFSRWEVTGAEQAMRDVLAFAGADYCRDGNCRDNVDAMYIDDVRTCDRPPYLFDTAWPGSLAEAGGWAQITQGSALPDRDNDGMPDSWEQRFKSTNPNVFDANADPDGDGYPNIEEYLSWLAHDNERYFNQTGAGTGSVPAYNCGRPMY